MWRIFKIGLFTAMTITMLWHWNIEEAKAEPVAIIATDSTAAPADDIFYAERIPSGHWENAGRHCITHYCPLECCNGKGRAWKNASGTPMVIGKTVAAGRQYPFGTKLLINGKIYIVEDRGVPNGHIDILVESDQVANDLGRYYTTVHVWKEDKN